jgi:DNA-binding NtrC family response regulator
MPKKARRAILLTTPQFGVGSWRATMRACKKRKHGALKAATLLFIIFQNSIAMKERIAIVEDDEINLDIFRNWIIRAVYEALPYSSARKAISDIADGLDYQLIISDMTFDEIGVNGMDVLEISKQYNPKTHALLLTGRIRIPPTFYNICDYVIEKPAKFEEFAPILRKYIEEF